MDVRCKCIKNLSRPIQIGHSFRLALPTGKKGTVRRPRRLNLHNDPSWHLNLVLQAACSPIKLLMKTKRPPPIVNNCKYLIPRSALCHFLINIPIAKYGTPTHKKFRTQMYGISIFHNAKLYLPKHKSVIRRIGTAQYRQFSQPCLSRNSTISNV